MHLKSQILSVLNNKHDFLSGFSQKFEEPKENIDPAFNQIINSVIYSLNIQCILNRRVDEICMIAKECSQINFNRRGLLSNLDIIIKGNGTNSELIGDRFGGIVDIISQQSGLKSGSVNKLFAVLTPAILSNIYFHYKAHNYTYQQLSFYLDKLTKRNQPDPKIKYGLIGLIKNVEIRDALQLQQPKQQHPLSRFVYSLSDFWQQKISWNFRFD